MKYYNITVNGVAYSVSVEDDCRWCCSGCCCSSCRTRCSCFRSAVEVKLRCPATSWT